MNSRLPVVNQPIKSNMRLDWRPSVTPAIRTVIEDINKDMIGKQSLFFAKAEFDLGVSTIYEVTTFRQTTDKILHLKMQYRHFMY